FFVDKDGTIVTAKHVVSEPEMGKLTVETPDGRKLPATLISTDKIEDLAVIKVSQAQSDQAQSSQLPAGKGQPDQFKPIALPVDPELPKPDSRAISLGFAYGAKQPYASLGKYTGETHIEASDGNGLKSWGTVYRYPGIETTNPGRPGQSGGPMFS